MAHVIPTKCPHEPLVAMGEFLSSDAELPAFIASGLPNQANLVKIGGQVVDDLVILGAEEPDILPHNSEVEMRTDPKQQVNANVLPDKVIEVVRRSEVRVISKPASPTRLNTHFRTLRLLFGFGALGRGQPSIDWLRG